MKVTIESKNLRLYLREWLGYLAVNKEKLEEITANVLAQALPNNKLKQDTYTLSHGRVYDVMEDAHTIFFVAKGNTYHNTLILKAYVTNKGYNNLEVYSKNNGKYTIYTLKDNFELVPLIHKVDNGYLKIRRNYVDNPNCYNLTLTKDKVEVNILIYSSNKAIKYVLRDDILEEAIMDENYFKISLSKIVDILSCSFRGENFNKAKIMIKIKTPLEDFKITIKNGQIGNIISSSKNGNSYHYIQDEDNLVPWNFSDKEFTGIGKEIKPTMKILERCQKEYKGR